MTVEEYLRSLVPGLDLQDNVVERCALSPIEVDLDPLEIDEEVDSDTLSETEFRMRLDYASSTVYYSVLGVFAGGGYSEQVGDVRASRGGYTITMADRARFKAMGDALRLKWGFEVEEDESSSEMYDASSLRYEVHRLS
ncbi:MAG: hypothetical protein J6T35_02530 [Bacteroidales bacterium]|nr:hypothetical protein [Bacteroidales bacterium]